MTQFNVIKYINELDINKENKKTLEMYISGDEFEEDVNELENNTTSIKRVCKIAINNKLDKMIH